ncbi:TIGR02147 family protein [Chitinispirillales bacterium ANBcel5]|uniref:TIGR02147 family protein n=1 Tax=Cellulosispirillum alkaliphilum TaxID=3039283 RepID=UPI002A4E3F35|nr:TIGR02147 family protein [Chitinispirillales bacterium ANBcel5]
MPSIFSYIDYREFLSDWLSEKKEENSIYSYRYLAGKLGIKSPGHLNLIVKGHINLSLKYLPSFARVMKMSKRERDYFETMVLYCHAKGVQEKKTPFRKITVISGISGSSIKGSAV